MKRQRDILRKLYRLGYRKCCVQSCTDDATLYVRMFVTDGNSSKITRTNIKREKT